MAAGLVSNAQQVTLRSSRDTIRNTKTLNSICAREQFTRDTEMSVKFVVPLSQTLWVDKKTLLNGQA